MVGCVVQARMGATRLPGKVLADLGGAPVLFRVIERLRLVPSIECIVVATSRESQDDVIAQKCAEWQVRCYRGSETDVLDRFYRAAALHGLRAVVRITADCPLIDPAVVEAVIQAFRVGKADYASNCHPPTWPDGLDTEVCSIAALERAWDESADLFDREHVTPYIWKHPGEFRLVNVESSSDYSDLRWTVDTATDLDHVRRLYDLQTDFRLAAIMAAQRSG